MTDAPMEVEPHASLRDVELTDVVETNAHYVIGISYQSSASKYPELAAQLKRYADAARDELMQAVAGQPQGEAASAAMYDLSLSFTEVLETSEVVAYAADGSSYTGGAHGMPLLARFVWLPQQRQMLTADRLVPHAAGWQAISSYAREQLHTALSQRLDADDLLPAERVELARSTGRMIDDGTTAEAGNFSQFEPLAGADGKLRGLRFVFAPYQVGPYSDGVQSVDVPESVLFPHIAPGYRGLFEGGSPSQ
ncbi:MAG: PdaC/SigV domain-containing protein [Lysobacter sp.]